MTQFKCPCSFDWVEEDGHDREILAECSVCVTNGGDYKKSPSWKETERAVLPPPSWRVDQSEQVDLSTGSTDGTVIPFPATAKARTAASARGRDKKAKKKAAAAAAKK
jgi:hypothetical protein